MTRNQVPGERIEVQDLTVAFGARVIQRGVSFGPPGNDLRDHGRSALGKSDVLEDDVGLLRPSSGTVTVDGEDYWAATGERRAVMGRRFGVLFQNGALWSSMTVAENVALPLQMFTTLPAGSDRRSIPCNSLPGRPGDRRRQDAAELSGGMRKRAALARALALDPEILLFDEPSAGLDPVTSGRLDELILELSAGLGATVVIVSHELPSLLGICNDGVFLDAATRTAIARGSPRSLRDGCDHPSVRAFMERGRSDPAQA